MLPPPATLLRNRRVQQARQKAARSVNQPFQAYCGMDFTRISGQFRGFATILGKVYALPKEIVATEAFATAEKAERSDSAST